MTETLCATCEYCGDAYIPVVDYRHEESGEIKPKFIGFADRYNGEPTSNPARHCNADKMRGKVTIYEMTEHHALPCQYYKPRSWERPATCGECGSKTCIHNDGTFSCSGFPFTATHKGSDLACANGKAEYGAQMELFI